MKKLNREIDAHLKQPDDNKFTTLKVSPILAKEFVDHEDDFL